jgi:uncharacterized damage-inducible protein DinB
MREPGAPVQKAKKGGRTHACRNVRPFAQQSPVLDQKLSSPPEVSCAAHRQSAARCREMLKEALSNGASKRVTRFSRGRWARSWPAGTTLFSYMFAHEAHHRGQAIMLDTSTGIQAAGQSRVCDLAMGEVLEAVRF